MVTAAASGSMTKEEVENRREYKLKVYDRILATISALGLIVSGLWGFKAYLDQGRNEIELRERELQLTIYREKKEVYYPLCETASAIVSCETSQEAKPFIMDFLKMYYGKAHLIFIDQGVDGSKIEFKKRMMKWVEEPEGGPPAPPPGDLVKLAIGLTDACRESLDPRRALRPVSRTSFAGDFADHNIAAGTKSFKIEVPKDSYGGKLTVQDGSSGKISICDALMDSGRIDIGKNCDVTIEIGDDVEGSIRVGENSTVHIRVKDSVDRGGSIIYHNAAKGSIVFDEQRVGEISVNRDNVSVRVGRGN